MVYAPYEPVSAEACVMAPRERLRRSRRGVVLLLARGGALPVDAAPEGQLTWTSRVTVVPAWFDPGEASVGSAPAARAESSLGRIQLHYTAPFDDLRLR
jgi:hypothetical protein